MSETKEYVVKPGDTLSSIAKELYGDGSEASWRKIFETNPSVIGPNPNMIRPGMKLTIPLKDEGTVAAQPPAEPEAEHKA